MLINSTCKYPDPRVQGLGFRVYLQNSLEYIDRDGAYLEKGHLRAICCSTQFIEVDRELLPASLSTRGEQFQEGF
jgi:hypothetical protein